MMCSQRVMQPPQLKVIFFDLGDTLVQQIAASPRGLRFGWVPGAKSLLERLRSIDIEIGIISNTGNLSRRQLVSALPPDFGLDTFVDELVLLSHEVQYEKPDPRIFRLAVYRAQGLASPELKMKLEPRELLFVGESPQEVIVAQQIGMVGARVCTGDHPDIGGLDDTLRNCGLIN